MISGFEPPEIGAILLLNFTFEALQNYFNFSFHGISSSQPGARSSLKRSLYTTTVELLLVIISRTSCGRLTIPRIIIGVITASETQSMPRKLFNESLSQISSGIPSNSKYKFSKFSNFLFVLLTRCNYCL